MDTEASHMHGVSCCLERMAARAQLKMPGQTVVSVHAHAEGIYWRGLHAVMGCCIAAIVSGQIEPTVL